MSTKADFFEYLGPDNSLVGYQRSYKIIFLIALFELIDDKGMARTIDVARKFKKFYEDRKIRGLIPDVDVEPRIQNIEQSTVDQVLSVIKDNPYRVINKRGFVNIQSITGEDYFCFDKDLYKELNNEDKERAIIKLRSKLDFYYSKIDNGVGSVENSESFRKLFEEFMDNYIDIRTSTPFAKTPIGALLTDKVPQMFRNFEFIDNSEFAIKGSYGNGNWTHTPWIAIYNEKITKTVQEGVYIVYLFSSDMQRVYLTLNQGCTKLKNSYGTKEAIKKMQELANQIRSKVDGRSFLKDNDLSIGHELYEKGSVFYKMYEKGKVPEDKQLIEDLERMMDIYKEYYQKFVDVDSEGEDEVPDITSIAELNTEFDVKDEVERISSYIKSKGFTYEKGLIENFYLALKSKPFVILAGTSGTGKSKLARLFAEAVGANADNGRFKLIPVRPDWSDSTDLLGYRDLNSKFHKGILTSIILKAKESPEYPFIVCLDEMNLARVEYYLSDILSIMESRRWSSDRIVTDRLIPEESLGDNGNEKELLQDIIIPDNLYIIGTVNMDETTFPFSKKVLDRANTIEFSYVDLDMRAIKEDDQQPELLHNNFLRSNYILLEDCVVYEEKINETISILKDINSALLAANLHFGYRVRDEICFYIVYNQIYDLLSFNEALDNVILQKILPRIQGSSVSIKRVLIELFKICIGNKSQQLSYDNAGVFEEMQKYLKENKNISYSKSVEKIAFMMRRFEEDGFTSYWM